MRAPLALVLACSLAACQDASAPASSLETPSVVTAPTPIAPPPAPEAPASSDPASTDAAADVIRGYYAAIGAGDTRRAYALWDRDGEASGQTYDQFAAGFADTESVTVDVQPASDGGGAAGSVYVTFPVIVRATTTGGADQTFTGTYTLRRVNDVPGATEAQLRWHIDSADLRPAR